MKLSIQLYLLFFTFTFNSSTPAVIAFLLSYYFLSHNSF